MMRANTTGAVAVLKAHIETRTDSTVDATYSMGKLLGEGTTILELFTGLVIVATAMVDMLREDHDVDALSELGLVFAQIENGVA